MDCQLKLQPLLEPHFSSDLVHSLPPLSLSPSHFTAVMALCDRETRLTAEESCEGEERREKEKTEEEEEEEREKELLRSDL